jgi:hypothetical protein
MCDPAVSVDRASVEVFFEGAADGNAGLVFGVSRAGVGADGFTGYEVSLDPQRKVARLGRHDQDYRLVRDVACEVPVGKWVRLAVVRSGGKIEVSVEGKVVMSVDGADLPAGGNVGVRTWQRAARFRNLAAGSTAVPLGGETGDVTSGMWKEFTRGQAMGATFVETRDPFVGGQSQRVRFAEGAGEFGVENRGLNRQGLSFVGGREYDGHLWARAEGATSVVVSLASADGARVYATKQVAVGDGGRGGWQRYDFALTPDATDAGGRLEVGLKAPGAVTLGYVFLEPGAWGRLGGLPVRGDVAAALREEGISAMRYGGSMVNNGEYRWKKMIGDRDRRPPYKNVWYAHSSNGWGIVDFLNFAEVAHIFPIPDFNADESPADMVDFIEYVNGDATTPWGARRVAEGHAAPYGLTHLELGNEERVDENYFKRFEPLARAIWAKDPKIVLTVGDFCYTQPIIDPYHFSGADSGITTLATHKKILDLAREYGAEVWFDIHVWTDAPVEAGRPWPWKTYVDAIDKLAGDAKHRVAIFELNANAHDQRRALANAQILLEIQRDGRLPFVASANCLQVDGQNDNGWDQGLLFLNPSRTWLQPPGLLWQILARNHQPKLVACEVGDKSVEAVATASEDGKTVAVQLLNLGGEAATVQVDVAGWEMGRAEVSAQTLSAALGAGNTAADPSAVRVVGTEAVPTCVLAPHSFTVVRCRRI